jgi:hypothetical protein
VVEKAIVAVADKPDSKGNVFPAEELERLAEESENLVFEDGCLYFVMEMVDPDPEAERILNENLWDLV